MDYGSIVYSSVSYDVLKRLYSVNNEALRICTGAFKSSPIWSLHAECHEMSPQLRHEQLSLQYAIKLKANKENPAYEEVFHGEDPLAGYASDNSSDIEEDASSEPITGTQSSQEGKRKSLPPQFCERIGEAAIQSNIPFERISQQSIPDIEPWLIQVPRIDYRLADRPKAETNPHQYKALFKEVVELYKDHTHIYTDGSKKEEKVGSAAVLSSEIVKKRLPDGSSIFSAEAVALIDALKIIDDSDISKFIIFTDSLSCLQAIENEDVSNALIQRFLVDYTALATKKKKHIAMCWIPSHIGIDGNEKADKAAKSSLNDAVSPLSIPFSDFIPQAKRYYHNLWQSIWDSSVNFLTLVHPELKKKIYDPTLSRREQRALCRIRIGHSRLTHAYRFDKNAEHPRCEDCNRRLTIKHIMVDCPKYEEERNTYLDGSTIEEIFNSPDRAIISYARECGFLNLL